MLPELVLGGWPLPWSPLFHAHGSTCLGLWPQTCPGIHPCSGPELGVWKELAHSKSEELGMSVVYLFTETSWFCPSIDSLCFFQLWFCGVVLSSSCVHLPTCTSYSVPKLYALKIISHTHSPVLVQLGPYVPKL